MILEHLLVHGPLGKIFALDDAASLDSKLSFLILAIRGDTGSRNPIRRYIGKLIPRTNILIALLLTSSQFFHDSLLVNQNTLISIYLLHDVLLLVDHLVQNHLQVLIVFVIFFLYVLDGLFNTDDFIVLGSDVLEFGLDSGGELFWFEEEFAEVKGLFFLYLLMVLVDLIFLLYSQLFVIFYEDFTLSLELFEVIEDALVDVGDSVHYYNHEHIVWRHA